MPFTHDSPRTKARRCSPPCCLWSRRRCCAPTTPSRCLIKLHTVTIVGTIKSVEWTNPHVWIWVSVPNAQGGMDDWGLESGGPSQMNRMGIRRSVFIPGEKITVDVYPMKDGRVGGQFSKATLANGQKIDMMQSVKAFAAGGQTVDGDATGGDAK